MVLCCIDRYHCEIETCDFTYIYPHLLVTQCLCREQLGQLKVFVNPKIITVIVRKNALLDSRSCNVRPVSFADSTQSLLFSRDTI